MTSYMHALGSLSPSLSGAARASDIVAALAPPVRSGSSTAALVKPPEEKSVGPIVASLVPGVIGAGVGAVVFRGKHPWLGGLTGFALASTAHPIVTGRGRRRAMFQLGVEGAGIAGSLAWKKHPFWGWVAGIAGGVVATAMFDGSPARELYDKWKRG